jgi:hypothetical protein
MATYISRTNGTATNSQKMTFSAWFKLGDQTAQKTLFGSVTGSGAYTQVKIMSAATHNNVFRFEATSVEGNAIDIKTNRSLRDPSAFYHLVISIDTTQASSSNRLKIYFNGVQETSFATSTYPTLNDTLDFSKTGIVAQIGAYNNTEHWNGVMSHVQFVDGLALAPTEFGETDATDGMWKLKTASYGTAGANGFHLKMEDSSNMDLDSSSNGHTFTTAGTLTATKDNPDNNFATMNPLLKSSYCTLSNGNTKTFGNAGADTGNCSTTLLATTGLYYAEIKSGTIYGTTYPRVGVQHTPNTNYGRCVNGTDGGAGGQGTPNNNEGYACANGQKMTSNTLSSFASAWVATDILAVAMDCTNGAAYVAINNVWQNSGDPTSGASKTGALVTWTPSDVDATAFASCDYNGSFLEWNFGNGYFGSTVIGSAVSSGNGLWQYSPPTNYVSLNTKEINS